MGVGCPLYGCPPAGCFSIRGSLIGDSGTVRSRGGVRATKGPLIEVLLYISTMYWLYYSMFAKMLGMCTHI